VSNSSQSGNDKAIKNLQAGYSGWRQSLSDFEKFYEEGRFDSDPAGLLACQDFIVHVNYHCQRVLALTAPSGFQQQGQPVSTQSQPTVPQE